MNAGETRRRSTLLLILLCGLVLVACGGNAVRGEPPLVQTAGWQVADGQLFLSLRLRNVNDDPLMVEELVLDVAVDGAAVPSIRSAPAIEIAPGGFEAVALDLGSDDTVLAHFADLSADAVDSVPYRIAGTVRTARIGDLPLRLEGRIYRVPGRAGEFR